MKLAINQPCYIPWYPYFDLIKNCDKIVFLDNVVISKKQTYINRNKFFYENKENWLTVPINKLQRKKLLSEIIINTNDLREHFNKFESYFYKEKYYNKYFQIYKNLTLNPVSDKLSDINLDFIKKILDLLGIKREIVLSSSIVPNKLVYKKSLVGADIVKILCLELKCNSLYNFFNGIEKKIPPFGDINFFTANKINLYQQDIMPFIKKYSYEDPINHSILGLLVTKGEIELEKYSKINYKKVI